MSWQQSQLHTDWSQSDYSIYISSRNGATLPIACAIQVGAHEAVVFGPDVERLKKFKFSASDIRSLAIQHDRYQSGRIRPKAGSDTAFFISLCEEVAGGIPRPDQREVVMREVFRRLVGMLRNGAEKQNALGAMTKAPFVPLSDENAKRRKTLDDLASLRGNV